MEGAPKHRRRPVNSKLTYYIRIYIYIYSMVGKINEAVKQVEKDLNQKKALIVLLGFANGILE